MYCIYKTHHPDGRFYYGKSSVARINDGYLGSGVKLRAALKGTRKEWACVVVQTFMSEADAYRHEGQLVDYALLANPLCLNTYGGGAGQYTSTERAPHEKRKRRPLPCLQARIVDVEERKMRLRELTEKACTATFNLTVEKFTLETIEEMAGLMFDVSPADFRRLTTERALFVS